MTPPPGSDTAVEQGCTCPRADNCNGRGSGMRDDKGEPLYWYTEGCPVHCKQEDARDE